MLNNVMDCLNNESLTMPGTRLKTMIVVCFLVLNSMPVKAGLDETLFDDGFELQNRFIDVAA
ncbi:MAG: hypothetical protein AAF446_09650, partial [Pseudomonadota bacterium]